MSDLTIDLPLPRRSLARHAGPGVRSMAAGRVFAATLGLSLAFCMTVPSSEVRAKAFKLALIAKSIKTRVSS